MRASVSSTEAGAEKAAEAATFDPKTSQPLDAQAELEATFWKADDLFQQGAHVEAAALFTKALELSQRSDVSDTWRQFSPQIAFNVAHSYRQARNCEAAQMAFSHYRGLVDTLPAEHAAWYEALLVECPALTPGNAATAAPELKREAADAAARPSEPSATGNWLLDVNTSRPADAQDGPTDVNRVVGWSTAAAAVVSLGLAGAFWVSAEHQEDLAKSKRLWAEAEGYQNTANTRHVVAGVLAGVGVALGGTSVYLLTRPGKTATRSAVALALRSEGTNLSIWGQF